MTSQPVPPARENAATIASRKPVPAVTTPAVPPAPARAPLDRAQDALPPALRRFPLQVLLAAGGLGAASFLVVAMGLARSDKTLAALEEDTPSAEPVAVQASAGSGAGAASPEPTPPAAPVEPSATELDAARSTGIDALKALAQRFPDNRGVLQALVVAEARDKKDHPGALAVLRHLLEVAPDKATDKEVQQALFDIANGPPETAADAFNIMKSAMGTHGPDALYEIIMRTGSTRSAKERAAAALIDPAVIKNESSALAVADELRRTLACGRKKLIDRAKSDGDSRSLPYLRPLATPKSCGRFSSLFGASDCGSACFTPPDRKAMSDAVEAIESRDPTTVRSAAPPAPSAPPAPGGGMLK